jgi:hypothetical protein
MLFALLHWLFALPGLAWVVVSHTPDHLVALARCARAACTLLQDHTLLEVMQRALRMASAVVAGSVLVFWTPSAWRVLRGREVGRDEMRALAVLFALAVAIFNSLNLLPSFGMLTRLRASVFAHVVMLTALCLTIYLNQRDTPGVKVGRVFLSHLLLVALCGAFVAVTR